MTNDSTSPGSSVDWAYLLANLGTIVVRQAKHYSCRLPLFGRPHSHEDRFHFSYVRSGKCRIRIDETALSVGADDLVFIRPGQVHESLGDKQVDYELIELRVSVDADADRTLIPAFKPVTHIDNAAVFFPILERVVTAYQLDPFPENWLVRVRLVEMMMVLAREEGPLTSTLTDRPAADTARRIQKAVDYIGIHYSEPVRIEDLAALTGWSVSHFAAKFQQTLQVSPIEFLIRRRLHHARELLQNSTLPIKQIAELCGFSSPQYFVRMFSQRDGQSPGKYRQKVLTRL